MNKNFLNIQILQSFFYIKFVIFHDVTFWRGLNIPIIFYSGIGIFWKLLQIFWKWKIQMSIVQRLQFLGRQVMLHEFNLCCFTCSMKEVLLRPNTLHFIVTRILSRLMDRNLNFEPFFEHYTQLYARVSGERDLS